MGNASFLTLFLETGNHFSKSCPISAVALTKYTIYGIAIELTDPLIIVPSILILNLNLNRRRDQHVGEISSESYLNTGEIKYKNTSVGRG